MNCVFSCMSYNYGNVSCDYRCNLTPFVITFVYYNNASCLYTHWNMPTRYLFTVFFNGNALVACRDLCERFPTRRPPDSRVFTGVYDKLHDTGASLSRHNSSECVDEQNVDQIENILQSVEHTHSPALNTRYFERVSVFSIQYGEHYVDMACILPIYCGCNTFM